MIIGITGTLAAGKGTIVDYLKSKGFKHYSARSYITEEVARRQMPINRDSMVFVANEFREMYGSSHIAEALYKKAEIDGGNAVIESLRTPAEVELLKKKDQFYLFAIDAAQDIRYFRAIERNSETDKIDFDTFKANEEREWANTDPTKGNIKRCIEMADYNFTNNGSVQELHKKIYETLNEIKLSIEKNNGKKYQRPSWNEYFMEIVCAVAKRGTCDRGRTGCVIVKNKQILATGYVGSAKGQPHCDDVGHLIEETIHADGIKRPHCVRTIHAEQNAICQAAKNGASIEGATIYCKLEPCAVCARMLVNSGIKKVFCQKRYHAAQESRKIFEMAGVDVVAMNDEVDEY
jgi:dCMP deaminase